MEQGILKLGRGGECRRRPSAHASACWLQDHIREVTLSQKKTRCRGPWGVKEPLLSSHISVLDRHGAQTWN